MSDFDVQIFTEQIKTNCDISDALFWGYYSICGLLMRYRELFRNEHSLMPWDPVPQTAIANWIAKKEHLWQELEHEPFKTIVIKGDRCNLFDVKKINSLIEKDALAYGAGYGAYMKPSFFLGKLIRKQKRENHHVYFLGKEYVRDLSAYPALLQDDLIFARKDVLLTIIWNKFEEMKTGRSAKSLAFAFSRYDISAEEPVSQDSYHRIIRITEEELETYVHHELGEASEGRRLGPEWKMLLSGITSRKIELLLRAVKDVLSDMSEKGMIRYIMENDKKASIGLYIAFLEGFRKLLSAEMVHAFEEFTESLDWSVINTARASCLAKTDLIASRVLDTFASHKNKATFQDVLESELQSLVPFRL
ncbi:MAG: hypothetical protein JSV13_03740 [Nitrospiraceae bacterium]|nr:MAG: hypothetical protein JSV13_03740 [Nitrospiraceae bacterium]